MNGTNDIGAVAAMGPVGGLCSPMGAPNQAKGFVDMRCVGDSDTVAKLLYARNAAINYGITINTQIEEAQKALNGAHQRQLENMVLVQGVEAAVTLLRKLSV